MNALLLAVTLVLHSGDRLPADGEVREANGVITFRHAGLLYSVPASEILRVEAPPEPGEEKPRRRLAVSEEQRKRLIAELEQNHGGTPPPPPPAPLPVAPRAPEPDAQDEHVWRSRARGHEENVRRAQEELALLESRADELQSEINTLFTLGFRPRQFTYQTTQLMRTRERIPYARLEVERAERVWQQFREDARRAGVMPGWLR